MNKKEYAKSLCNYPTALNVKEVAEILRICMKTAYKLVNNGTIPSIKFGREKRIAKSDLINFMRARELSLNPVKNSCHNTPKIVWTSEDAYGIVPVGKNRYKLQKGIEIYDNGQILGKRSS